MTLYSSPPSLREWQYDKPTLLVCWWASAFCATLIVLRVAGRFIRTERLFREDKMAALALIPITLRMGCVHYILRAGTNNADFSGVSLSPDEIRRKQIASGLVLASRVLYAATLWILKDSILEFFRRLTGVTWSRAYEKTLFAIRCALVATLAAVVVSTLAECRPFAHYWQVLPDPGGQCRQGYAHLITLAACNIVTDLVLVLFPAPIIMRTRMPIKRKAQLVVLFSLSLAVVAVTVYRIPHVIAQHGRQQYRSLLASIELIFATAASNSLVLGSFVRDKGLKKNKFNLGSVAAAAEAMPYRPTLNRHWGSDENLVRDLGLGVQPELRHEPDDMPFRRARPVGDFDPWRMPPSRQPARRASTSPPKVIINDAGSLPELGSPETDTELTAMATSSPGTGVWRPSSAPLPVVLASTSGTLRGSSSLLLDIGGRLLALPPTSSMPASPAHTPPSEPIPPISQSRRPSSIPQPQLRDPGGLLSRR